MRRGTTPTLEVQVQGYDLESLKDVYVTILQQGVYALTKTKSSSGVEVNGDKFYISLSQKETLKFHDGHARVQMRGINDAGEAIASDIAVIRVEPVLLEEVID